VCSSDLEHAEVYARQAAIHAIERLDANDIVSVIAYDSEVNVIVPATKVSDREQIFQQINSLAPGSSTALCAGVCKGADEVRKFFSKNRVNRVILLSDGLANVGPQTPAELGALGAAFGREGISVTTFGLGLGYNEDLMAQLAGKSDGNHAFIEDPRDLARIFDYEFGDVLSVSAQDVVVSIDCGEGVRPVRSLGREAAIDGRKVTATLNQLYGKQEKYVLLEVELTPGEIGSTRQVAEVRVTYANMQTKAIDKLASTASVRFSGSEEEVKNGENKPVMVEVVRQIANDNNRLAMTLRDQGKMEEAKNYLNTNIGYLNKNAAAYSSEDLKKLSGTNSLDLNNLDGENWNGYRKGMVKRQFQLEWQQGY